MASNSYLCGICNFRNISVESVIWCSECDEGLCSDCQEHHSLSKGTRQHKTMPISEYQKLPLKILEISQLCCEHNERYQIFCRKHDAPCCKKCVIENHNKCEHLADIDDVSQNVKTSHAFLDTEKNLNEVLENIERICKDRKENLFEIELQRREITDKIQETKEMINNHLDKLQEVLVHELNLREEIERRNVEKLIESIEEKKQVICEYNANIEKIKLHASDLQTFLAMKRMQSDIADTEEIIESAIDCNELCRTVIECDFDPMLLKFQSNVTKFGDLNVRRNSSELSLVSYKKQEAQMMLTDLSSQYFDQLTLLLEQTVQTVGLTQLSGCTMLSDGRMVFSRFETKGQIRVLNRDGSVDFEINTEYEVRDVVKLNEDNYIAVTSARSSPITIIDLKERKKVKTISVERNTYGITARKNLLLYCVHGKGIRQLNLNDTSIKNIVNCHLSCSYITTFRDNIYYTSRDIGSVTCCDLQGRLIWQFKNNSVLKWPFGISVDSYGNVFVAGSRSHNVVVISPDGQHYKQLLSEKDGLVNPRTLYFDRSSNCLLVANKHNGKVFLFKVT